MDVSHGSYHRYHWADLKFIEKIYRFRSSYSARNHVFGNIDWHASDTNLVNEGSDSSQV